MKTQVSGRCTVVATGLFGDVENYKERDFYLSWYPAFGQGKLPETSATLHQRWSYGIARRGTSLSVDTGKYLTAPWMARELVDDLAG